MNRFIGLLCLSATICWGADQTPFFLGKELLLENNGKQAAVEFRRFAMDTEIPAEQKAASYLFAAYSYLQDDTPLLAEKMIRQAEELDDSNLSIPLLYAEAAAAKGDDVSALYFFDLCSASDDCHFNEYSTLRSTEILLRSERTSDAQNYIEKSFLNEKETVLGVIADYNNKPRKKPMIGGLLGLFPGAGYWYSGETANGFRSLLLNSLFMYGMYHTAEKDQWGAFGVISFFEITWYSGSVYGGIDAAHRYNQGLMDQCIEKLNVPELMPEHEITLPLFQLKVLF